MHTIGAIYVSRQFQASNDGAFEFCFGFWREYRLTGTGIRRDGDEESKEDDLVV